MPESDWQYVIDVFNEEETYDAGIEAAMTHIEEAYEQAYRSMDAIGRAPSYEPSLSFDPTSKGATADTEQVGEDGDYGDRYAASITVGQPKTRPTGDDGEDEPVSLVGALQHELHHLYVRERLGQQEDWDEHEHAQYASVPVLEQGTDEAFSEMLTYCVESDTITKTEAHEYIEEMTQRYKEHAGRSTAESFYETATAIADRLPETGDGLEQYASASSFIDDLIVDESHPREDA